jgi:hypothetical protein
MFFKVDTMKICLCSLLVFASLSYDTSAVGEREASVDRVSLKVTKVSNSGIISIQLTNSSKELIKLWKDSNSWGAARWRVLLIRKGQLETFYQNPDQEFTVNMPSFHEIAGGANIEQKLDLNGGNWCGAGHCASYAERGIGGREVKFEQGDLTIVIYDVPFFPESLSMGVWYGVAATSRSIQ